MKYHNTFSQLDPRLYHRQPPTPLDSPTPVHFNQNLAKKIGWSEDDDLMQNWVDIIGGAYVPKGFCPLAMAYAGHQFGQWAGQLGDGRGLLLAQVIDNTGKLQDLHLKGSGLTPYSRMGDGRAVLRSSIREYLGGHALTQLGIASSSALGIVTSKTPVQRETIESGAALIRVADCHIRLGHIEWIASFAPDLLKPFTDYMIATYFPDCLSADHPVLAFLEKVVKNTARLIADWQLIGFAHGVMNTDNLSITGSTLDFGPFGFMERFNPAWINNHSDFTGRYAYQNQPAIGHWNLNVWLPHFMRLSGISRQGLGEALAHYEPVFMQRYQTGLCDKIGLPHDEDSLGVGFDWLTLLQDCRLDYTNSFRALLALIAPDDFTFEAQLLETLNQEIENQGDKARQSWQNWQSRYQALWQKLPQEEVINRLTANNPVYILRNDMAQRAIIEAEKGDFNEVARLFELLSQPFKVQDIATNLDITPPNHDAPPLSISCSS
ncbi:protein adenylyltransferase SelO [Psychrobacter ciconiae]|uniref:protein adenylyltransferase SelO n=1 Tax=Psychrobacter ciconiae TaxID=1553449 RepID=UPI001919D182|nr:YdiU family protein [Psychrobacter ciconiae]